MDLKYNKRYGQFYTRHNFIDKFFKIEKIKKYNSILEPSFGSGVLFISYIKYLINNNIKIDEIEKIVKHSILIEIDNSAFQIGKTRIIEFLDKNKIKKKPRFIKNNFFKVNIKEIELILMNPPYIRRRNISKEISKNIPSELINNAFGNYDIYIFFLE